MYLTSDESNFYQTLTSALTENLGDDIRRKEIDLREVRERDGRAQLTVRMAGRIEEVLVLNFYGGAPFLHFSHEAHQLQVLGSDSAVLSDQRLGAHELATRLGQQIRKELKCCAENATADPRETNARN